MSRETCTTASLTAGIDAVIGNARKHCLVAGAQVMAVIEAAKLILSKLLNKGRVISIEVLTRVVHGIRIGKEGGKLEHVSLIVQKLSLLLCAILSAELSSHNRVSAGDSKGMSK